MVQARYSARSFMGKGLLSFWANGNGHRQESKLDNENKHHHPHIHIFQTLLTWF
jgi:hypothetical protein